MIEFSVFGIPRPAGSKRAFVQGGRAMVVDASPQARPWKQEVTGAAVQAMGNQEPLAGALDVRLTFTMPRPKAHFKPIGTLRPDAPEYHSIRPDADKLSRAVLDALTGVVWRDDAQVAVKRVRKVYGSAPSVWVLVVPL